MVKFYNDGVTFTYLSSTDELQSSYVILYDLTTSIGSWRASVGHGRRLTCRVSACRRHGNATWYRWSIRQQGCCTWQRLQRLHLLAPNLVLALLRHTDTGL